MSEPLTLTCNGNIAYTVGNSQKMKIITKLTFVALGEILKIDSNLLYTPDEQATDLNNC